MGPDLPVADQPKQARREFAKVEKGVGIQVEQDGKNLAVGEAFQSRRVVSFETADVRLSQLIWKVVQDHLVRCTKFLTWPPSFVILTLEVEMLKKVFKLLQWRKV